MYSCLAARAPLWCVTLIGGEMSDPNAVSSHYTRGNLLQTILERLSALGKTPETVTVADLGAVDEFHTGGRRATVDFLSQFGLSSGQRVLDIGCGLGGTARYAASHYGVRISGIDLTAEFVETGNVMCGWVGLADQVSLFEGSALDLPFDDASFDAAYMLHVGMNIADKGALCAGVARVLRPGCAFGIYDIMRTGPGELKFPVPWAENANISAVAEPGDYKRALEEAGFTLTHERNRRDFALAFFEELWARMAAAGGPPALGTHVLMRASAAERLRNLAENIAAGRIAPVELIAHKR